LQQRAAIMSAGGWAAPGQFLRKGIGTTQKFHRGESLQPEYENRKLDTADGQDLN